MSFVTKTPAEFEAMSEYQKEKYLDEKAKHEQAVIKELAEKSAKEAIEAQKEELEKANQSLIAELTKANDAKLAEFAEKHALQLDDMQKALNRAKVGEINERMKGMSEHIIEKLSTPEGETMVKSFLRGKREGLNLEVDSDSLKAMVTPTGGVAPQFAPIVGGGFDDIQARTVIPVLPTIADIINFIELTPTNATPGFGTVGAGEQKPTLEYDSEVKQSYVRKIAGLLDIADEMMDDVVGFRAWLAYELPKAYLDAESYQIFKGDGAGTNLIGLWYQADPQTLPLGTVTSSSNTIDKICAGITEIRLNKRGTSAVFISPVEWMEILINKDNEDAYTYPIVLRADGVMTIGGVPIYWSNVFNEGEGLVGDFSRGCAIYQRKEMTVAYSSEHKDNFGKNIVTVRLEGRIALVITYPDAFLKLFNTTS